jgi:hypothetical protein
MTAVPAKMLLPAATVTVAPRGVQVVGMDDESGAVKKDVTPVAATRVTRIHPADPSTNGTDTVEEPEKEFDPVDDMTKVTTPVEARATP